jgi:hypothetical protein
MNILGELMDNARAIEYAKYLIEYCKSFEEGCDGCVFRKESKDNYSCSLFQKYPQDWAIPKSNEQEISELLEALKEKLGPNKSIKIIEEDEILVKSNNRTTEIDVSAIFPNLMETITCPDCDGRKFVAHGPSTHFNCGPCHRCNGTGVIDNGRYKPTDGELEDKQHIMRNVYSAFNQWREKHKDESIAIEFTNGFAQKLIGECNWAEINDCEYDGKLVNDIINEMINKNDK